MSIVFVPDGSVGSLERAIQEVVASGAQSLQILGAVENGWTPKVLDPILAEVPVPTFGGVFPGVIYEREAYERGSIVIGHDREAKIAVVELSTEALPADEQWAPALDGADTVIAYLDATRPSAELMRALFRNQGGRATWFGGGAGGLDFAPRPVIITPDGLQGGVAVLAGLDARTSLGVTHGWAAFGEPMLVTESDGNDILTLDFRPAQEAYCEAVEQHSGRRFDDVGFFALASRYPLILERFGGEGVVRDPLSVLPGGSLRCAGAVPQYATVRIDTASAPTPPAALSDWLAGGPNAPPPALARASVPPGALTLTIDCISRSLLLEERLRDELAALRLPGTTQVGALTIGEVASGANNFLQVHNKTTVLALLDTRTGRR